MRVAPPASTGNRRRTGPRVPGLVLLAGLACAGLAPGCREELGPEHFPTARVSGVILEGGQPVGGGWVEFIPVDGTVGDIRSARIGPDGSFSADGVAVGENALRLVQAPIRMPRADRLFGQFATPVRRKIPREPREALRIDLLEEALRFQAARTRRAGPGGEAAATGAEP